MLPAATITQVGKHSLRLSCPTKCLSEINNKA